MKIIDCAPVVYFKKGDIDVSYGGPTKSDPQYGEKVWVGMNVRGMSIIFPPDQMRNMFPGVPYNVTNIAHITDLEAHITYNLFPNVKLASIARNTLQNILTERDDENVIVTRLKVNRNCTPQRGPGAPRGSSSFMVDIQQLRDTDVVVVNSALDRETLAEVTTLYPYLWTSSWTAITERVPQEYQFAFSGSMVFKSPVTGPDGRDEVCLLYTSPSPRD